MEDAGMSLERARADLADLEQAADALRAKLAEVEASAAKVRIYIEMAALYGASPPPAPTASPAGAPNGASRPARSKGGRPRREGGIVDKAQRAAEAFLRTTKQATDIGEIFQALENQGISIGGLHPRSNLSGMLSKSPALQSSKDGWMLSEWANASESNDAAPSGADGESVVHKGSGLFVDDPA
jgi:hypothetical protein